MYSDSAMDKIAAAIQCSTCRILLENIILLLKKGCRVNREAKFLENLW